MFYATLLFPHYLNASDVGLPAETLIRLRLPSPVRFSNTKIGDSVQLEVAEDVKVGDLTVIRRGTPVRATITTIFQVGSHPRMSMKVSSAELVTSQTVGLQASPGYRILNFYSDDGQSDIAVAKGTEVTVYTDGFLVVNTNGPAAHPVDPHGTVTVGSLGNSGQRLKRRQTSPASNTGKGNQQPSSVHSRNRGAISSAANQAEALVSDTVDKLKPPNIDADDPPPTLIAKVLRYIIAMVAIGVFGTLIFFAITMLLNLLGKRQSAHKA